MSGLALPGAAILPQGGVNRQGTDIRGITREQGDENQVPGWTLAPFSVSLDQPLLQSGLSVPFCKVGWCTVRLQKASLAGYSRGKVAPDHCNFPGASVDLQRSGKGRGKQGISYPKHSLTRAFQTHIHTCA